MVLLVTKTHGSFLPFFCISYGGTLFFLVFCPLAEKIISIYLGIASSVLTISCSCQKNDIHHCFKVLQRKRTSRFL